MAGKRVGSTGPVARLFPPKMCLVPPMFVRVTIFVSPSNIYQFQLRGRCTSAETKSFALFTCTGSGLISPKPTWLKTHSCPRRNVKSPTIRNLTIELQLRVRLYKVVVGSNLS